VVPITPLRSTASRAAGAATDSFTGPATLPLPSGNVAGFGSSIATVNTGSYEYVVVGAPGAGRAFVYKKALTSDMFTGPTELVGSGSGFGTSVGIRWGTVAVGGSGKVTMFSQPRDANGFPLEDDLRGFQASPTQPNPFLTDSGFGRSVALAPTVDGPVVVCGLAVCQTFYQVWQKGYPAGTGSLDLGWNQTGPTQPGDYAFASTIGALAVVNPNTNPNTVSIYNASGTYSYAGPSAQSPFGPPGGGTFTGTVVGSYDRFLVGVSLGVLGTQFYTYSATSLSPLTWGQGANPEFTMLVSNLGKTMVTNTDTWIVSNSSGSGGSGGASVYRLKLDRHGTYYNYSDDTWTQDLIANGTSTFGAGLAISTSFFVVGDPGLTQATAYGNDQQLVQNTYSSQPTGAATITFTTVAGSAAPVIQEESCTGVAGNYIEPNTFVGPCLAVSLNSPLVGTARVCYSASSSNPSVGILRCSPPLPTNPPSCSSPDKLNTFTGGCCSHIPPDSSGTGTVCADTDHFSDVMAGTLTDSDGDFVPDIDDNCPGVPNTDQRDTTGAAVGDACNCALPGVKLGPTGAPCPAVAAAVPIPSSAVAVVALLLGVAGIASVRRIKTRRASRSPT
jgi:hypothetical protein